MSWMFWKKGEQGPRLPGPKGMPQAVGSYLVTNANMPPDLVWGLKAVILPRPDDKNVIDVRVYDNNRTEREGIKVVNYHSLDDRSALVIFDGWYNKETHAVGRKRWP